MSSVPNHVERQFMQQLRGRGWVKSSELPEALKTINRLLDKRWIERQGTAKDLFYRITEQGLAAKTAPIPLKKERAPSSV